MSGAFGVPDLLSLARLGRANTDIRQKLAEAQQELVTGEAADKAAATNGDPLRFMALENEISRIDSRLPLISMAKSRAGAMQTALGNAQDAVGDYATRVLGFAVQGDVNSARTIAKDARTILSQVMSAFNVQVSGRHVFGGDAGGSPPLGDADALLAQVRAAYGGTLKDATPQTLQIGIDDPLNPGTTITEDADWKTQIAHYFGVAYDGVEPPEIASPLLAPEIGKLSLPSETRFSNDVAGAGYAPATLYTGGQGRPPKVELSGDASLDYAVEADDPAIRRLVMNLAVIAVAGENTTNAAMLADLQTAAQGLIGANDAVTALRTGLGQDQARIENAEARAQAERASFVLARNDLVGRDPFDAATRVTELERQLQTVYAMTARTSELSLLNFLR